MRTFLSVGMYMLVPLLTAIYTVNYGRWAGRRGNRRGAWGLYVLAVLTVAVPLVVLLLRLPG